MTQSLPRYRELEHLGASQDIRRVVGHSMGGSVALEYQRHHSGVEAETYGAPVATFSRSEHRHRDLFDPVSILDFGADSAHLTLPHSYYGP